MVDNILLRELAVDDEMVNEELAAVFGESPDPNQMGSVMENTVGSFQPGSILKGKVIGTAGDGVIVDVGLKSEGVIPKREWDDPGSIEVGQEVDALLEAVESDSGTVVLSKRKADRILNWQRIVKTSTEGDEVEGRVVRKIKGGLLVDIGVPVFLPASQVDIRRPSDVGELVGKTVQAKILKIDTQRRNIVISRRRLIEEKRQIAKEKLLSTLEVGQRIKGTVKNIADFGAFVDLGGIDGLLHITDMSWDRINHPSELVKIDEEIEVCVLNIDRDKEKIALGLKQKTANPWEEVETKYPVGEKVQGEVVNIMNYGAFVKLEPGVEGLVHISEMSWTRRIAHPSEMLSVGQTVDVVVLAINKDKQEISLGIKQTEVNPWTRVAERYPPNTIVDGVVRNLANYGAFIEVEEGIDGLLHLSDMSWTKKISHPSEMLKKGEKTRCVVLSVDEDKQRIALGLKQLHEDPWLHAVPTNYIPGQIVQGTVTKITNFGVFVELEPDLEGLLHISELADHKVEDPHKEVNIGDTIEVKILRVDTQDRKIGLSKKRAEWIAEEEGGAGKEKKIKPRRGGLMGPGEISTDLISNPVVASQPPQEVPAPIPSGGDEASDSGVESESAPDAAASPQENAPASQAVAESAPEGHGAPEDEVGSEPSADSAKAEDEPGVAGSTSPEGKADDTSE
jgi:small subunit ribosomal protein S1